MPADAVRWPGPRAVVAGARGADRRAARAGGPDDLVGRRHRHPAARGRRPARRHRGAAVPRAPTRSRTWSSGTLATSALFASRFRENAARALLLPRRRPGHADAALAAAPAGGRPARGRLALRLVPDPRRDVPRVPVGRLRPAGPARDPGRRRPPRDRRSTASRRRAPRRSRAACMFDYVAAYMYDGDTPLAERRAGALTLDRDLLRELLGQEELRELLDPDALADLELSLQALTDDRQATTLDGVHDLLRRLGDLSTAEVAARTEGGLAAAGPWLDELAAARRAVRTRIAGDDRWLAIEDVARYRDGVGISPPVGVPAAFLGPAAGALDGLLARWARTHGPFLTPEPARRWGLPVGVVEDALERLLGAGTLLRGEFRPGGAEREWCDPEVLRLLRRRSLARLRREVEPVDPAALGAVPARLAGRRPGRAPAGRRCAARPAWSGSPRSSTSWPGCRSRPRSWSGTCCRRGSRATSRACSTSSAPSARSPGWGGGASAATTAGSRWSGPGARSCGRPARPTTPSHRPSPVTSRSASTSRRVARRSTASCSRQRAGRRTARSSTRCGTWCGPARSPTTRSRRCAPCAGSGPGAARVAPTAASGAAHRARTARGRRPLVAGRPAGRDRRPSGSTPRASPCSSGTAC